MASQQEVIKAFMKALDETNLAGESALDEAVRACSHFKGIQDLINNCVSVAGGGNFLLGYCGINLDNKDTGAITGYDAGSGTVKNAESIILENDNIHDFTGNSFTINGLTVSLGNIPYDGSSVGTPSSLDYSNLSDTQKYIWKAFETWWANGAINLITDSYGNNYGFTSSSFTKIMYFGFFDETPNSKGNVILAWTSCPDNVLAMAVNINPSVYGNLISGGNPNGKTVSGYTYLDRTLAHEMTHAVMMANIVSFDSLPQFIKEGMAELTHGIDDDRTKDIEDLSNRAEYLKSLLSLDDKGTANGPVYAAGYILLRYLARQASSYGKYNTYIDNRNDIILNNNANENTDIISNGNHVVINGLDGNDTITANGNYSTISGGAGNDSIIIYGNNVSADSGTGVDTIEVHGSNVTIDGGGSFDYLPVRDTFRIGFDATNVYIENFESEDELIIPSSYYLEVLNGSTYVKRSDGTVAITLIDFEGIVYDVPYKPKEFSNKVYNGTDNNDNINLEGDNVTIYAGDGDDTVYVNGENWVIDSGIGKDRIINQKGYPVKILGGQDDDVLVVVLDESQSGINNFSASAGNFVPLLDGGSGNDSIQNAQGKSSITGGSGNDSITNSGAKVTIGAGVGNDSIYNSGDLTSISGGEDNDTINNNANNVTIDSGSGDDSIYTFGYRNSINGGNGNDFIENRNDFVTINGGADDDIIENRGISATIDGGADNDSIYNSSLGANVSINGGTGNDSILNGYYYSYYSNKNFYSSVGASSVTIDGGDGNDFIQSGGNFALIRGDEGKDSIKNDGENSTIDGGAGNDSITNGDWRDGGGSNVVMLGNDGADYIFNGSLGSNASISGGDGNDSISNYGSNVSISAGDGNDSIENQVSNVTIDGGEGNDHIRNSGDSVTINGGAGNDFIDNWSDSVTIDGGEGNDSIDNTGNDSTIDGGQGDDRITVGGSNVSIDGGDGADRITVGGSNVSIDGGADDDYIYSSGDTVSIDGGQGDDTIRNYGNNVTINAGDGNDYIGNEGDNVAINGGAGNDNISNSGYYDAEGNYVSSDNVIINAGAGDNEIFNDGKDSTIISGAGNDYILSSGDNVSINAGDGDNIIRNYGANVLISGGAGNDSIYNDDNNSGKNGGDYVTINAGDGDDTITNFGKNVQLVDGGAGNDDIYSGGDYATISGGEGDDTISNSGKNVTIQGGDDNDSISNNGEDVTLDAGDGDDRIWNGGDNSSISGGNGNDSIRNFGDVSTIDGGAGDDSIYNSSEYVTINGGDGNDSIYNSSYSDTISIAGGDGDDTIDNHGYSVTINAGNGNDIIYASGITLVEYALGEGDDTIYNFHGSDTLVVEGGVYSTQVDGSDVIVKVGDGSITLKDAKGKLFNIKGTHETNIFTGNESNDAIKNNIDSATIQTFGGDDTIANEGNNVIIEAGAGNDSIENGDHYYKDSVLYVLGGDDSTITMGDGDDIVWNYGANVSIDGGEGNDYIRNAGANVLISGGDGNDYIDNEGDNVAINGGAGNDSIYNACNNVTVNGGTGDDYISNHGTNVIISGGAGDDTIYNWDTEIWNEETQQYDTITADNSTLLGGAGDDYIYNTGDDSTIDGGDGNDSIYNSSYGDTVSIAGGDGDDTISNHGTNVIINGGDGRDKILNGGGKNVLLDGGEGNDSIYNLKGKFWNEETQQYDTISPDNSTLLGGAGNDLIVNDSENATFVYSAGDGNDTINGFNETSTLDLGGATYSSKTGGNDITITVGTGSILLLGAATLDNLNIIGEKAAATWTLNGTTATFGDLITLSGVKSLDGISLSGNVVTVGKNSLNGKAVELTGDGYTLALGSDVPTSAAENPGAFTNFANGTATFTTNASGEFYTLNGNKITYTAATAGKSITIKGLAKNLMLNDGELVGITAETSNGVTTFKIREDALTEGDVTITGDNCKLALDGYTAPAAVPATFVDGVYTQAYTPAHYTATDKKISYVKQVGGDKFSITGLADGSGIDNGISVDAKGTVTISKNALNGETITLTNDTKDGVNKITYKLAVDKSSVPTSSTKVKAAWSKDGDAYTYTAAYTPAYYKLSGNKLTYAKKVGGEQFTLNDLASTSGIKISGKNITIGKTALGNKNVTFSTSDGYKLAFDKTVTTAKEIKSGWTGKSGTFTYTAAGITAGYQLDGNQIVYKEQIGGDKFTITGVKDTKAVSVNGNVVSVGKNSLNGKSVELKGNYTLALADDVPQSATKNPGSFTAFAKGTATFKTSSYSNDFYTLDGNKLTYTAKGGNDIKISNLNPNATLADVQSAIEISDEDGSLKISFNSVDVLNNKAPSISVPKGISYTVAVDDTLSVAKQAPVWAVKSTNATLSVDTSATYKTSGTKITCTPKKSGSAQVVITGLVKNAALTLPKEKVLTLDASVLDKKTLLKSNPGGYSIELTGDMSGKTFVGSTGADTIDVAADNALVDGGKGNDEFDISGENVTILSSAGNDTANFADGLTVSLSGTTTVKELAQIDDGVQLTFSNKATLTVTDVDDTFEVVGKKQTFTVDTSKFAVAKNLMFDKTSVTVAADFTGALTPDDDIYTGGKLSTVAMIDASAVTEGISIEGNAKANYIIGGGGDDTLWGGDGQDIFIYDSGDGKDVVRGFSDDDLLEIVGNFTTSINKSGTEIALKVGKGSLTLKDFTAEEFNINGEVYQISGNELVKK